MELSLNEIQISPKWDDLSSNGKIEKDSIRYAMEAVNKFRAMLLNKEYQTNLKRLEKLNSEEEKIELLKLNLDLAKEKSQLFSGHKPPMLN